MAASRRGVWMAVALGACAGAAVGQGVSPATTYVTEDGAMLGSDAPPWIVAMAADPQSPAMRALAAQNKERKALEKQVRQIRHQYLKSAKADVLQEGIVRLRDLIAPGGAYHVAAFPMLLEVFERDDMAIRAQVLDMIRDSRTDEGDTTLAWAAVMSDEKAMREAAKQRLLERVRERDNARAQVRALHGQPAEANGTRGPVLPSVAITTVGTRSVARERRDYPAGVAQVVNEGLRTRREHTMAAAADLASVLGMFEAIPGLIAGQVSGAGFGGGAAGTDRTGDLAWIMVGHQVAYVSDLTPVVGEAAVGFDPTISVVTEGVILRIKDAAVFAYSFDVHNALVALADTATDAGPGQSTASMGFDTRKWQDWWAQNKPKVAAKAGC